MKKLESFKQFEENNLSLITGGKGGGISYTWEPTQYDSGVHDEHQITHENGKQLIDAMYNCETGEFDY